MTCAGVWPSWLSGALVGGTVVYLGILFHEYARAFWRAPRSLKKHHQG